MTDQSTPTFGERLDMLDADELHAVAAKNVSDAFWSMTTRGVNDLEPAAVERKLARAMAAWQQYRREVGK